MYKYNRIVSVMNNYEHPEREFIETYIALKIKLGYVDILPGNEGISDILTRFAGKAVKSFGHGLAFVAGRTFNIIRNQAIKAFNDYKHILAIWKTKVWKNSRLIDGNKFDAYTIRMVPYAILKDRINAVLAIHQALEHVKTILDAPVQANNNWLTTDCQKAIDVMAKIGYNATDFNMLDDSLSSMYNKASLKQAIFLHKYTLNNIMGLFDYVEKIANYADPKYIKAYEEKFELCTDKLNEDEEDILHKEMEDTEDTKEKEIVKDKYELSMRSSRMWWIIHFIKAAYKVTNDIFKDMERLTIISERCISKDV